MLTLFGASALTFMMLMYALERRHRLFVLAFALGCALSSAYGFLAGTWPFGVVELIWVLIALRRYFTPAAGVVIAALNDSSALYLLGSILSGVGFGIAYLGGLRGLVAAIPGEHRAAVMSAFYLVAYSAGSTPAVIAGLLVGHLGLLPTFEVFGSIVSAIALIVAAEAWRTRPARNHLPPLEEPASALL